MPKIPLTKHEKSSIYAQKYPSEFRVLPNGELICKLCDKPVNSDKKFAIDNHRACGVHQNKLRQGTASSSTITSTLSTNSFDADFLLSRRKNISTYMKLAGEKLKVSIFIIF